MYCCVSVVSAEAFRFLATGTAEAQQTLWHYYGRGPVISTVYPSPLSPPLHTSRLLWGSLSCARARTAVCVACRWHASPERHYGHQRVRWTPAPPPPPHCLSPRVTLKGYTHILRLLTRRGVHPPCPCAQSICSLCDRPGRVQATRRVRVGAAGHPACVVAGSEGRAPPPTSPQQRR